MIRGWGVRWYTVENVIIETRRSRWRTNYRVSTLRGAVRSDKILQQNCLTSRI
jgi:hypothetical protein